MSQIIVDTTVLPDVSTLTDAQVLELLAGLKSRTKVASSAAKAERDARKAFTTSVVNSIVEGAGPRATFSSGAEGWSLGGTILASDGKTYKVNILLRDAETVPAKSE